MQDLREENVCTKENPELVSVRRIPTVNLHKECPSTKFSNLSGIDNPAMDLEDGKVEGLKVSFNSSVDDIREAETGSKFSLHQPLTGSPVNNLERQSQLWGLKNAITRVSSLTGNRQSFKGKSTLPGPSDFNKSWTGVEHYLREMTKDNDPESFTPRKKKFYRRTWFTCIIYIILLLLLTAAILGIACYQALVVPRRHAVGQVLPVTTEATYGKVEASPVQNVFDWTAFPAFTTDSVTTESATDVEPFTDSFVDDGTTLQPKMTTESSTDVQPFADSFVDDGTTLQPKMTTESSTDVEQFTESFNDDGGTTLMPKKITTESSIEVGQFTDSFGDDGTTLQPEITNTEVETTFDPETTSKLEESTTVVETTAWNTSPNTTTTLTTEPAMTSTDSTALPETTSLATSTVPVTSPDALTVIPTSQREVDTTPIYPLQEEDIMTNNWLYILSLPGPLQRLASFRNSFTA